MVTKIADIHHRLCRRRQAGVRTHRSRGGAHGFDREDWRLAESELKTPARYSYPSGPSDGRGTMRNAVVDGIDGRPF
jgi:hypothetical protein